MSTLKQFSNTGQVDFVQNGTPNSSVVGARVGHEWCDYSTGTIWTCTDATFGSQRWEGDDGSIIASITRFDHPNLITAYTMDNISGITVNDESPNGYNATAVGAVSYVPGKLGNAVDCKNTLQWVEESGSLASVTGSTGAICYWMNADNLSGLSVVSWAATGLTNEYLYFAALDGGTGASQIGISSATGGVSRFLTTASGIIGLNTWHFVVMQCTGTSYEVWIDGVERPLTPQVGSNDGASWWDEIIFNKFAIDRVPRSTALNGNNTLYDQVRVFNRALTSGEIAELYNGGVGA